MGRMTTFRRPDGNIALGYLAIADQGRPGVVVLQEWWGMNDQICGVTDRLARAGFNALAPDLYRGHSTYVWDEAAHLKSKMDFQDALRQDLRGAVTLLKSLGGKVATLGFCMGGALSLAAAVHLPELDAATSYYGVTSKENADPAKFRVPFQGHYADIDEWHTPAMVNELEKALPASGIKFEIHRYPAEHGFLNEHRPEYNVEAANQSWERLLVFLKQNL